MAVGVEFGLRSVHTLDDLTAQTTRSLRRLSSGLRVTSAADDASGLATATKLDSRRLAMRMVHRSAQEAAGLADAADGHLQSAVGELQRLRSMVLQRSGSTAAGTPGAEAVQAEATAVLGHLDASLRGATYGTFRLFQPPRAPYVPAVPATPPVAPTPAVAPTPGSPGTPAVPATAGTLTGAGVTGIGGSGGFDNTAGTAGSLHLIVDGVARSVTLAAANMNTRNQVRGALQTALTAAGVGVTVTLDATQRLVLTAALGSTVTLAATPGSAASAGALNLVGGSVVAGNAGSPGTPPIAATPGSLGSPGSPGSPGTPASGGDQPASHELRFQLGPDGDQALALELPALDAGRLGLDGLDLSDAGALGRIDAALASVLGVVGRLGAFQSRLRAAASFALEQAGLLDHAADRIVGADMGVEHTELIRHSVRLQAAGAVAGQGRSLDVRQAARLLDGARR